MWSPKSKLKKIISNFYKIFKENLSAASTRSDPSIAKIKKKHTRNMLRLVFLVGTVKNWFVRNMLFAGTLYGMALIKSRWFIPLLVYKARCASQIINVSSAYWIVSGRILTCCGIISIISIISVKLCKNLLRESAIRMKSIGDKWIYLHQCFKKWFQRLNKSYARYFQNFQFSVKIQEYHFFSH